MSQGSKLIGTDKVLRNLEKKVKKIKGATRIGIEQALTKVEADAIPLTPVDTSNLRQSFSVRVRDTGREIIGIIANTASYAVYVHERLELKHTVGKAKFLEEAIKNNLINIIRIISKFARTK